MFDYCYDKTELFNTLAGNLNPDNPPNWDSLKKQLDLIQEELNEAFAAVETKDRLELLDSMADIRVTVDGFTQMLSMLGYAVYLAHTRVCDNNLSKFIPDKDEKDVQKTMDFYRDTMGISCIAIHNKEEGMWAVRNAKTNKLMKKVGYRPVELEDCLPSDGAHSEGYDG